MRHARPGQRHPVAARSRRVRGHVLPGGRSRRVDGGGGGAPRRAGGRPGGLDAAPRLRSCARPPLHAGRPRASHDGGVCGGAAGCVRAPAGPGGVALMGLRVLHLGKYYPPHRGGIETVLEAACAGAGAFIEPRALVLNTARRTVHEIVDGIPVTRVRQPGDRRCGVADALAGLVAPPSRGRRGGAARAQPDGARRLRDRASGGAADRVVPQRGDPRALEVPAVLPAAVELGAPPRRPHRRGRAADARRAGAGRATGTRWP